MAQNSTPSLLDSPQIVKRVFDPLNDSVRVNLGDVNGLSFNLSATGDTIGTQGVSTSTKVTGLANATTGVNTVVLGPVSCVGMKSFQLFTNTTATITGAQVMTVQVNPSDADNVWINTTLTITESTTSGTVVMGTANSAIVGRQVRVISAAAITSGTFDLYLVMQGN